MSAIRTVIFLIAGKLDFRAVNPNHTPHARLMRDDAECSS
jgi:hypothetical protein